MMMLLARHASFSAGATRAMDRPRFPHYGDTPTTFRRRHSISRHDLCRRASYAENADTDGHAATPITSFVNIKSILHFSMRK